MIVGFGVDVLDISRVDLRLAKRILTGEELSARTVDETYVAGRFALKESYFKALGTGVDGNSFQDISFLKRENGALLAKIHRYRKAVGGSYNRLNASLSHDRFAFASVVLEKVEGGVFLGLRSNLGDRRDHIERALEELGARVRVVKVSTLHETKPYGKTDQSNFLNAVVEIDTDLTPDELLRFALEVEEKLGRVRLEKSGPRAVDIDILFYGNLCISSQSLVIPHYDFENREFFIRPMLEVAPNFVHPVSMKTVRQIWEDHLKASP